MFGLRKVMTMKKWSLKGWLLPATAVVVVLLGLQGAAAQARTVDDVVKNYKDRVEAKLEPRFRYFEAAWPPKEIVLLAIKESRNLELWAKDGERWVHVYNYPIRALSGVLGPKLKQGDKQVPEGFYRIDRLNPNSNFHLSMELNYPNLYDRIQAGRDDRDNLGGDIYIHGNEVSTGCLAMGDSAIEDLFVLTALVGIGNTQVIIAPKDFRAQPVERLGENVPDWVLELHQGIAKNMELFKAVNN
jgi:murein L,D-transpeptidase YafK